jgi:hypothetical protein
MGTGGDAGTSVFFNPQQAGMGEVTPADELMHWECCEETEHPGLVETQWFGFSVPEHDIDVLTYLWAHPNIKLISGGVWGWQGIKRDTLASEMFDMQNFIPDELVREGDLDDYRLDCGYRVEILEPLQKVRIRYDDESRRNSFDVTLTAIMPPAPVASGKHFDQAVRTEGKLLLRGKPYEVNGFHMRDRSWGETRPETARAVPPIYYSVPVFGEDLVVHVTAVDDPDRDPAWRGMFSWDGEMAAEYNRGWIWRDGELFAVEEVSVQTAWDAATGHVTGQSIELTDSGGRELEVRGTVTAACPWHTYPNMRAEICLTRWECEGRTGWGDLQAIAWNDFLHQLMG